MRPFWSVQRSFAYFWPEFAYWRCAWWPHSSSDWTRLLNIIIIVSTSKSKSIMLFLNFFPLIFNRFRSPPRDDSSPIRPTAHISSVECIHRNWWTERMSYSRISRLAYTIHVYFYMEYPIHFWFRFDESQFFFDVGLASLSWNFFYVRIYVCRK